MSAQPEENHHAQNTSTPGGIWCFPAGSLLAVLIVTRFKGRELPLEPTRWSGLSSHPLVTEGG